MKKGLLILALFAVVISASAQRDPGSWSLIPRLGVSIANMTDNDLVIGVDGSSSVPNTKREWLAVWMWNTRS